MFLINELYCILVLETVKMFLVVVGGRLHATADFMLYSRNSTSERVKESYGTTFARHYSAYGWTS